MNHTRSALTIHRVLSYLVFAQVLDFFFRLHVMDYAGGEDFNNTPLRVFAVCALAFALSGAVLTFTAARRALRAARRRRAATSASAA